VHDILQVVFMHALNAIATATAGTYVHRAQHEHTLAVRLLADRLLPVVAHRQTEGRPALT